MRRVLMIVLLVLVFSGPARGTEGEGYEATISEKTDVYLDTRKIATIPESALFRAMRVRDDWVYGSYRDVDTDRVIEGWIKMKGISDVGEMLKALKAESENYLLDGERRYEEKKYAEAVKLLTETLDRYPMQPAALKMRAESYMALRKRKEAGEDYSRIIKIAPESEEGLDALLGRAHIFIASKKYNDALGDLNRALKMDPNNAEAYLYKGDVYSAYGKYGQAVVQYDKGIGSDPRMSALYYKRGMAHYRLNMFDEAVADLGKAAELNKTNPAYAKAKHTVDLYVKRLKSIPPRMAQRMLDVKIDRKDKHVRVYVTNKSSQPLINIEVAMVVFIGATLEKGVDASDRDPHGFHRAGVRKQENAAPLDIEAHEIKYLSGRARGSRRNARVIVGKSYADALDEAGINMPFTTYDINVKMDEENVGRISEALYRDSPASTGGDE